MSQIGLFDVDNRLAELSKMGDPLEKLNAVIDWKQFKPIIERAFRKDRKSNAGRPPFAHILMFKILILQSMYTLSDAQTQFQVIDRHSFKRFLGLRDEDRIPDEKTIWLFRETLARQDVIKKLFDLFDRFLNEAGYNAKKGQMIDATFVEVPRQRNTREENKAIKEDEIPDGWEDKPAMLRQKDTDARWMNKNKETHYGYKNHLNVDAKNKLIREYAVTAASVHDSQVFEELFDPDNTGKMIYADSAYRSETSSEILKRHGLYNRINRKSYRNRPLSRFQEEMNRKRSSVRARIEHVNGRLAQFIGRWIHCIGRLRAAAKIGLLNLVYNMTRYAYLEGRA
jgi:transposase, IS5 family